MVLNYYSEKVVNVVFVIAVILMIGLYFFPGETLNIVGAASASVRPIFDVFGAILGLIRDLIVAIISSIL